MEGESARFYLAKNLPFTLPVTVSPRDRGKDARLELPSSQTIDTVKCSTAEGLPQKQLATKLASEFKNRKIGIVFGFRCEQSYDTRGVLACETTTFRLYFVAPSIREFGHSLHEILDGRTAFLQVEMFDGWTAQEETTYKTKEMPLSLPPKNSVIVCEDDTPSPVIHSLAFDDNIPSISGEINLVLIVKGCVPDKLAVCKRMLEEELAPDAVILPINGVEVKCHRGFLAAHSDVFQAMFGTDMQEAKTRRIEMPDMSEEGVRAFLAYLYHWDTSKAEKKCSVAVEVLMAGHKYNIRYLETAMRKLVLGKPEIWYEVDVAVKLFLFVRNMGAEWEPLKKKAVMVMKKNWPNLKTTSTFQELFREDPDAAMDFCEYAISIMSIS